MRPKLLALTLCVIVVPLASTAPARAQAGCEHRKAGEHCYTFDDDLLNSDVASPNAATLTVRVPPARTYLLRPRTSFVTELYESVEHL